jgi:mannosyltransferase
MKNSKVNPLFPIRPEKLGDPAIPRWRSQYLPIGLILVLATALYIYHLGHESLWTDELISVDRAKTENIDLIRVRPLYPLLLNVWMRFGSSDAWLRGLNVCFALGSVLLIYQLGRRLINEFVGTTAALIFALSPLVIHHAQEVRMYMPCIFLGLLGSLVFVSALENPKLHWIGLWAIIRWLAILSTPLVLFLVVPDTVLFLYIYRKRPRILFRFAVGLILIGALWLPWVARVIINSLEFVGVETVDDIVKQKNPPDIFSFIFQFGDFTAWPFGKPNSNAIQLFYKLYSWLVFCLMGLWLFRPRLRNSRLSWVAAWAFLPLIFLFTVSFGPRSLWVNRYLVFTAPYAFIVLATCLWELGRIQRWLAVGVASIYLVAVAGGIERYYTVDDRENWRGLVETINQNEQPGDLIVWSMGQENPVALNHYYQGEENIEVISKGHKLLMSEESEIDSAEAWISNLPKTSSRIWLAYTMTSPEFLSVLEAKYTILEHQTFSGYLDIFLIEPKVAK